MGGLCSREDRATFDDVKAWKHLESKQNANNHVASGGQSSHAEATVPTRELIALKGQLQQLQERNTALLSAAKDSESRCAELQSKLQKLQKEHDELQRKFETTRDQLAASGLQAQLEARAEAERKLDEIQKQCSELKRMNSQLQRHVSDLATGHAEPPVGGPPVEQPTTASEQRNREVLIMLRDINPGSKISVAFWRSPDFKRWQGVRTFNGDVTGLALSSMQLTVLPSELGQLTGLTALFLSNNGLTQLPPTLGLITCLTSLLLDGNNLKQLPAELCDLTQLQTLWLHDNQLSCLPHALGKLTNLRQLIVNDNALEQLPQSIGELKGLTSLWLDNNKLTALPETFSQLTELKRLRVDSALKKLVPEQLRGNGALTQLPQRGAASASPGLDKSSTRVAECGSPRLNAQQRLEQDPEDASCAGDAPQWQDEGGDGQNIPQNCNLALSGVAAPMANRSRKDFLRAASGGKCSKEHLAASSPSGNGESPGLAALELHVGGEIFTKPAPLS